MVILELTRMFTKDHLAAVKELRVGIEAAEKALAELKAAKDAAGADGDGINDVSLAQAKADKALSDLREATEGLVPRVEELKEKGGNEAHLAAFDG